MALPGKVNLRKKIAEHGGVVSDIADHFRVTRQTIYNWLDHYELRENLTAARQSMRAVAADVIYARLMAEDNGQSFEAAKFVMLHLKADGELLALSPEVLLMLRQMGMDTSAVVAAFEQMVRQAAAVNSTPSDKACLVPTATSEMGDS